MGHEAGLLGVWCFYKIDFFFGVKMELFSLSSWFNEKMFLAALCMMVLFKYYKIWSSVGSHYG